MNHQDSHENPKVLVSLYKTKANGDPTYTDNPDEAQGYRVYVSLGVAVVDEQTFDTGEEAEAYAGHLSNIHQTEPEYI